MNNQPPSTCHRTRKAVGTAVILAALSGLTATADTLVQYSMATNNFATAPSNGGAASGATAPYADIFNSSLLSSASTITVGPGDNYGGTTITNIVLTYRTSGTFADQSGGQGPTPAFPTLNAQLPNGTYVAAGNALIYFQFSLTASADFHLTDLYFDLSMGSTSASTRGVDVVYSLDNFSSSVDLGAFGTGNQTADNYFYNIASLSNVLVSAGQTLSVQFHPYSTSGGGVRFDNIGIDVTPVPEPGSLALLAVGGFGGWFLRRKIG